MWTCNWRIAVQLSVQVHTVFAVVLLWHNKKAPNTGELVTDAELYITYATVCPFVALSKALL